MEEGLATAKQQQQQQQELTTAAKHSSGSSIARGALKFIDIWAAELAKLSSAPHTSESSFTSAVTKRVSVQRRLYLAHVRQRLRSEKNESNNKEESLMTTCESPSTAILRGTLINAASSSLQSSQSGSTVPLMSRLAVMMCFSMIEALKSAPGIDYSHLTARTLEMIAQVLATAPAWGLYNDPADSLDTIHS